MTPETPDIPQQFVVVTRGEVSDADVAHAVRRLSPILDKIGEPVLFARLKLTHSADPGRARPALAQATLDINGDLVRAHTAAETFRGSVDLLKQRLEDLVDHRAERRRTTRRRGEESKGWRRGDLPTSRPEYYDRPLKERELVRRKSFTYGEMTPEESAVDMEQMDHDFHLFTDLGTGEDALVERSGDGSYRVTHLHPDATAGESAGRDFEISNNAPPGVSVDEAIRRLDATGARYLFFRDADTDRGHVVYRRYDGHYGLITPT